MQRRSNMEMENGRSFSFKEVDDDGRATRTGTWVTASAHIITAVIGSGVLSLAWATAQIGWIGGPIILIAFSVVTWFTSALLADCYRHPVTGERHYTYKEAVKGILGGNKYRACAAVQYAQLVGVSIGYTITASISMAAVERAICFHKHHLRTGCHTTNDKFMLAFGVFQLLLSQVPSLHNLSWISVLAAVMSFGYSTIGIGLSIAQIASGNNNNHVTTSLGVTRAGVTTTETAWNVLTSVGNMAFSYCFSVVLIEIQDTLRDRADCPEDVAVKKATSIGISTTTIIYMLCGLVGYAAFGNNAPGNFLTGFGFYEPYWLVAIANIFIVIHLVGAFQVFTQPIFSFIEEQCATKWPNSRFITTTTTTTGSILNLKIVFRSVYVVLVTLVAMLFPFFNDFVGFLGALSFWPLTVYFPVEMHIAARNIPRFSPQWVFLQLLSLLCLFVSLLAGSASIRGLIINLNNYQPLRSVS